MSRPVTPASGLAGPAPAASGLTPAPAGSRPTSYIGADVLAIAGIDHAASGTPADTSYLATDDVLTSEHAPELQRSNSQMSQSATYVSSRGGTLKKKASLHKTGSLRRSGSRKSSYAGSVRSLKLGEKDKYEPEEYNSAFYCPVPTGTSPTEILANRFQTWRRVLKDLIGYFRDLHKSYEVRSKTFLSASNVINNITLPGDFLQTGGIGDAAEILRGFHKQSVNEANKARDLQNDVILQLTGLRSDLSQKIKEIKSLSGDFKNSVHKEQDGTRKAVNAFQEALGLVDQDAAAAAGKGDPFLMKLGVERQLERQIEEENYLHRAFLNLEASGRELESIVIGEIQKAYNVLAGIMKRDGDCNYETAEKLREGPLAMAKDHEWDTFVTDNPNMVDPRQPLRQVASITYQGKDHPAAIEVKSGMLERKSKYLKNYTPGWYILSPTHLHEFKSADQIPFQAPVMSLYLPEQKLGSHSEPGSSSHKFMLKGRQTGSMHRGHTWIFRAETHDTMMAWFHDIKELTEKRGEARNEFVRRTHTRSVSGGSQKALSIASGESQMDEDEADQVAFSGVQSIRGVQPDQGLENRMYGAGGSIRSGIAGDDARSEAGWRPQRPQPGGRFPSDVNVTRGLQAPLSPSSGDSGDEHDREAIAAASALPGSAVPFVATSTTVPHTDLQQPMRNEPTLPSSELSNRVDDPATGYTAGEHARVNANATGAEIAPDTQSQYREWVGATGAGVAGVGAGAMGATAAQRYGQQSAVENTKPALASSEPAVPAYGRSPVPAYTSVGAPTPAPMTTSMATSAGAPMTAQSGPYEAANTSRAAGPGSDYHQSIHHASTTAAPVTQPQFSNGTLIGATDIRAPAGLQYTSTQPNPIAVPSAVNDTNVRPGPVSAKSINTISDLHIPGEYPKSATDVYRQS